MAEYTWAWRYDLSPSHAYAVKGQPYRRIVFGVKPAGSGRVVVVNAKLINPILGTPSANFVGDLNEGQLKALAEVWAELCHSGHASFGDAEDVSGLLVEGEGPSAFIDRQGAIFLVNSYSSARLK